MPRTHDSLQLGALVLHYDVQIDVHGDVQDDVDILRWEAPQGPQAAEQLYHTVAATLKTLGCTLADLVAAQRSSA